MTLHRQAPSVTVSSTDREITAYGGAVLLRETARAVGLSDAVEQHLHLKQRDRGLSEAGFVVGTAEAIALGASCLDDLALARADDSQRQMRGFEIAAPQTAGTWLRRFSLGHIRQLDKALAQVQRNAFTAAGVREVTLDFDSSYVYSRTSRREGADPTYKKAYALHPLFCFDAVSGAAVHARLRRGRSGASTGMESFLRETLRRVPAGIRVRARFDSGFYGDRLFSQMERASITYVCGVPFSGPIRDAIARIPERCWGPCLDDKDGQVAEFGYRTREGLRFRRYIVKRIARRRGEQLELETGSYRYWCSVTSDHAATAAQVESEHRHKALVESGVRELKGNFGLRAMRKHGFMANWAWLLLVCTGHNLCCWTQQLGHLEAGRGGADLKAKRLRYRYLAIPGLLVRSARRLTLKLRSDYPYRRRFLAALARLQHLPAPTS